MTTDSTLLTAAIGILLLAFFLIYPIYGALRMRRSPSRADGPRAARWRLFEYKETLVVEWLVTGALAALWLVTARPCSALRLTLGSGWQAHLAIALAVLGCLLLVAQVVIIGRSAEQRRKTREQMQSLALLVPHDKRELRWFGAVSLTAGFCEEVLYRGFLLWFLEPHLGLFGAAVAAVALFGFGHIYQGLSGFLRTSVVGAVLMALVLLAGSIWPAVLLHIAIDLASGCLAYLCFRDQDPSSLDGWPATTAQPSP